MKNHLRYQKAVLMITGMRNNDCRERVAEALGRVRGVMQVDVSLLRARATVLHEPGCEPDLLMRAVGEAGYSAMLVNECNRT